jgi:hypothetical protein
LWWLLPAEGEFATAFEGGLNMRLRKHVGWVEVALDALDANLARMSSAAVASQCLDSSFPLSSDCVDVWIGTVGVRHVR